MKNFALLALIATNAATGFLYFDSKTQVDYLAPRVAELEATKTTINERAEFGSQCLKWLKEEGEKEGRNGAEFFLGRSWKKHGQLVFEVMFPKDETGEKVGDAVCTYDVQSGVMFSYFGSDRDRWMFY